MKVILTADVKKVGTRHQVVEVAQGFAENVLFPKKQALPATPANLAKLQGAVLRKADSKALEGALLAKSISELNGKTIALTVRANEAGKLFQTVHPKQVVAAIADAHHITLPESAVESAEFKQVGEYPIRLSGGGAVGVVTLSIQN